MFEPLRRLLDALGLGGEATDGADEPTSCEEALERLFEYLDGELEGETQEKVARHFEVCRRCYPRLRFEKAFVDAVRRVERGEDAPPRLRRRVLEVLEDEGLEPR